MVLLKYGDETYFRSNTSKSPLYAIRSSLHDRNHLPPSIQYYGRALQWIVWACSYYWMEWQGWTKKSQKMDKYSRSNGSMQSKSNYKQGFRDLQTDFCPRNAMHEKYNHMPALPSLSPQVMVPIIHLKPPWPNKDKQASSGWLEAVIITWKHQLSTDNRKHSPLTNRCTCRRRQLHLYSIGRTLNWHRWKSDRHAWDSFHGRCQSLSLGYRKMRSRSGSIMQRGGDWKNRSSPRPHNIDLLDHTTARPRLHCLPSEPIPHAWQ